MPFNLMKPRRDSHNREKYDSEGSVVDILPFALRFLTLSELVETRLTCHEWKETIEENVSANECADALRKHLVAQNLLLAADDSSLTESWKQASNETTEHVMRLFQATSSPLSAINAQENAPATATSNMVAPEPEHSQDFGEDHRKPAAVTASRSSPASLPYRSPLRTLLATLRIVNAMPKEAAVCFSRLYGRHILPLKSTPTSHRVAIETFPPCSFGSERCKGCSLVNHIPTKEEQPEPGDPTEKQQQQLLHSSFNSSLSSLYNDIMNQNLSGNDDNQSHDTVDLNQSRNSISLGVEDLNQSNGSLGYDMAEYLVIDAGPPPTAVSTASHSNPENQKPTPKRNTLQLEKYFPVCAPNLEPDLVCPLCGIYDKQTRKQQERTMFLTEISYESSETCDLWSDTKLTFTPTSEGLPGAASVVAATADAVVPTEPSSTELTRSMLHAEKDDGTSTSDKTRERDPNATSPTASKRRIRPRLSSDSLDLLVPFAAVAASRGKPVVEVPRQVGPKEHCDRISPPLPAVPSESFLSYPPPPFYDVAVPIRSRVPPSYRPANTESPRNNPSASPYRHCDRVKNCLSIHCNKCNQFAVLAPVVPCHSQSFACDGVRSLSTGWKMEDRTSGQSQKADQSLQSRAMSCDEGRGLCNECVKVQGESDVVDDESIQFGDDVNSDDNVVVGAVLVRQRCNGKTACAKATYCIACSDEMWHFPLTTDPNLPLRAQQQQDLVVHSSACTTCNLRLCREHAWLSTVCHHS